MAEDRAPAVARDPRAAGEGYADWIRDFDTLDDEARKAIRRAVGRMAKRPLVSIVMTGKGKSLGGGERRAATTRSVLRQLYPEWELLVPLGSAPPADGDDARVRILASTSFNAAIDQARGAYLCFVGSGDMIPPHALYCLLAAAAESGCALVYSDEDEVDPSGLRLNHHFKPDWDPDRFLGQDYACRLALLDARLAHGRGRGMPGRRAVYDLILQAIRREPRLAVGHVPHVLYHRRSDHGIGEAEGQAMRRSVEEHVQLLPRRDGFPAPAVLAIAPGLQRIVWPLPMRPPRVSAVIATRDRASPLRGCVEGLRFATDYPDLEIVIAGNGSAEPATPAHDRRIKVVAHPGPFSVPAFANLAAGHATGELLLMLDHDIDIREPV
jgi:hypothetical protein